MKQTTFNLYKKEKTMHVTILTDLSEEAINNMIDRVYVAARTFYSAYTCA